MKVATFALAFSAALTPLAANAGPVQELRVGLMAHNTPLLESKNANKEASPNIAGEIVFASPQILSWAFAPRPYLSASVNSGGDTSFVAAGLEWQARFGDVWSVQPGLGYALHNGETNNPFPNGDPRGTAFNRDKVLLGSEDLFRVSLALTRELGPKWSAGLLWEHYSHGQILGENRNQGMDEVGLRFSRRLGE
jgi:lipid A 3-O-deacylase